jgi:hypothetical protein
MVTTPLQMPLQAETDPKLRHLCNQFQTHCIKDQRRLVQLLVISSCQTANCLAKFPDIPASSAAEFSAELGATFSFLRIQFE